MRLFSHQSNFAFNLITILLCLTQSNYFSFSDKSVDLAPIVYELVEEEFTPFITKHDPVMVMFYSPHCGHCHKMKPEYEKLPSELKEFNTNVSIARVDGSENKNLLSEQNIEGFPTIKLYIQDEVIDYKGERTSSAMSQWIRKVTGTPVFILTNESEIEHDPLDVHFIGYFETKESSLYQQYLTFATNNRLSSSYFAIIPSNKELITVVKEDGERLDYKGQNFEELESFIKDEMFPKLTVVTPTNFEKIINRNLDFAWFEGSKNDYDTYCQTLRDVSLKFKNQLSFVWIDSELYSSKESDSSSPSFMLNLLNGTRYDLPNASAVLNDAEAVINFLKDAQAGKIPPFLKSDEIPEPSDSPVLSIVAKNFLENVFQPDRDVMVEIYAPWCGHCKQLEPIYLEVAQHFQNNPNVLIAKMDGSSNESPSEDFDWQGFPTIFFIKAGQETPMLYQGDRTKEEIIKFINENGSNFQQSDEL